MSTKIEATIDDLYKVEGKAELVNGEILIVAPTGILPGYTAGAIFTSLSRYSKQHSLGYAMGDNLAYVVNLPHRKSFCPDVSLYVGKLTMKFAEGPPVFAVEVRSEGDYGRYAERQMANKRADYFAAGTLVVWDVDILSTEVVRVYRATTPEIPVFYRRGKTPQANPAVPG